jgi:thiol:disulfide interchange protein DsbC
LPIGYETIHDINDIYPGTQKSRSERMTRLARKWISTGITLLICTGCLLAAPVLAAGQEKAAAKEPCSSMSEAELHGIFDKLAGAPGGVTIVSHRPAPVEGLCEIAVGSVMNPQILYLDARKKFILPGPIFDARTMTNLSLAARQEIQDRARIDVSRIPLDNALLLGEKQAAKKVIVFTDPDCPFCATLHQTLHNIVAGRKDVAFLIKIVPLHKESYWKAKSILCNRSLPMLEDAFQKKEIPRTDCQRDEAGRNLELARSLELSATPTMIFPNGSIIVGAVPESELLKKLDEKK